MPGRNRHSPLRVLLNNRFVGRVHKAASGAISFHYDQGWLDWDHALPVSLSMPLREDPYRGAPVLALFDNLLPDSDALRRRVAERVGAAGTDAYSLLAAIGHDCVGALQFMGENDEPGEVGSIQGEPVNEQEIERLLKGLARAPLGLDRDDPFRISIAGAQEKTALLWHGSQWIRPHGTTPTSHILKTQIGELPNGIDLSNSVENEYYCLRLAAAFGLPASDATIQTFGETKALVVERFDRHWSSDGRLLRLPQEDCCQALSIPPTRKYQSEGGPGLVQILDLLKGSDNPTADQLTVFKAQVLFWLIGATDGHAKNFSVYLGPGGTYQLTPLYDVLTAEPSLKTGQIQKKQMKLAMSVGKNNHYRLDEIHGRHFLQSAESANLPKTLVRNAIKELAQSSEEALARVESMLPDGFPKIISVAVGEALEHRLKKMDA